MTDPHVTNSQPTPGSVDTTLEPGQKPNEIAPPSRAQQVLRDILGGSAMISVLAVLLALLAGGVLIAFTDSDVQEAAGYFFARPLDTIQAIWSDPFSPDLLKKLKENPPTLRQTRLAAEEAEEQLLSVPDFATETATLKALLLGAQMLDYAGMEGLYAIELDELWQAEAKARGQDEESWQLLDMAFGDMHGRTHDLLDALSVLAPSYKENWLAEYAPYRMTTALARWDLEIAYWLRTEQRYAQFRKAYQKGTDLPQLHSIAREP